MKNKLLLIILVLIFIVPIILADDPVFKKGEVVDIAEGCFNNGTYCSSSASCNVTIWSPNNTILVDNQIMTNLGNKHNYTLTASQSSDSGIYRYNIICEDGGVAGYNTFNFEVTPSGFALASDTLIVIIYALFILAFIGIVYTFFLSLYKLGTASQSLYIVLLSIGFYLLMIIVTRLSGFYLVDTFILTLSEEMLTTTRYSNVMFPLISWVVTLFITALKRKKPISDGGFR